MGATSDIDQIVNSSLVAFFDACADDNKATAIAYVQNRLADKRRDFEKSVKAIEAIAHLAELADHHGVYTSDIRLRLMRKMMDILKVHQEHHPKLDEYRTDIMPKRNDLAHIRVEVNGFSRKLYDRKGNELTSDHMRALRVALLDFQDLFDTLFGSVIAK